MEVPEKSRLLRVSRLGQVGLFLAILLLPLAAQLSGYSPKVSLQENRNLEKRPPLPRNWGALVSFPAAFEAYYKDNFGFRKLLIQAHTVFKTKALKQSPNRKAIIGRDGWLYFAGEDESFQKYQPPFSAAELRDLTSTIERRKVGYEKNGTRFFILVPPDKQSIYPENLPEPQLTWSKTNLYDQLLRHFTAHSSFDVFVDAKGPILSEKKTGAKIYYQTDTHWNDRAAWQAYLAVMARLRKDDHEVLGISAMDISWVPRSHSGDLVTSQLGVPRLYEETSEFLVPRFAPSAVMRTEEREFHGAPLNYPALISDSPRGIPRTVLFLRDSQLIPLIPYFSESFRRVVYLNHWEKAETINKIIAAEKPDIVIHELVERALRALVLFKVPPEMGKTP